MEKDQLVLIYSKPKSYFMIFLATICLVIGFTSLFILILSHFVEFGAFTILIGTITYWLLKVGFNLAKHFIYYFDLKNNRFKKQNDFLGIKFGFWKDLPKLEYVSISYMYSAYYQVKIWHSYSSFYKIFTFINPKSAVLNAFDIAKKLNLEVYDSKQRITFNNKQEDLCLNHYEKIT